MSSHREAPAISKDPVADNTDLYAFVDPADTSKVTFLANFIPLEEPAGGPNFFQFGDEVLYEILIDNDGDGEEDVVYQFRFKTVVQNPGTFLYNTGPISSLTDPNWNVRQSYTVTKIQGLRDEGRATAEGARPGEERSPGRDGALGASLAPRRATDQRGRDRARGEGPMEQPTSEAGRSVPRRLCASATAEPPADPLSRRLPEPRGADRLRSFAGRPRRDLADGDPGRHHPRVPELEWADPGGRTAPEPRLRALLRSDGFRDQPARGQCEAVRPPRGRPRRLPERTPRLRQRDGGRAAGDCRRHVPADRQHLYTGRGGGAVDGRHEGGPSLPVDVPVPRDAVRGVRALPRLIRPRFGSRVAVPAASTKAHDWGGGLKRPPWHQVEGGRVRAGDGWLDPGDRCAIRRGVEARGSPRRTGAAVPVPVARTTGGGDEPPSPQGP